MRSASFGPRKRLEIVREEDEERCCARTRRAKVGRREAEGGAGGRERESEVEAANSIGRDACERRKETVDQTSRTSEASVWNEDVSISRQIEQHASRAPLIFITASGPYRVLALVSFGTDGRS